VVWLLPLLKIIANFKFKKMITKTLSNTGGASHNVDYKTNKKANTAPVIIESFIGDDGEVRHILDNGRETLDTAYVNMWGAKKGIVNWRGKGVNPNHRKII
jgi:hypothetical protein